MRGGGCEIDVEDWWWCKDAEGVEAEGVGGAGGMTMESGRRKLWMIMWMRAVGVRGAVSISSAWQKKRE